MLSKKAWTEQENEKVKFFSVFSTQGKTEAILIFYIYHRKNPRKTIWWGFKKLSSIFHDSQNTYVFHGSILSTVFLQTSSTENFAVSFSFLFQCSPILANTKLFPI